jgi:tetratricopeptide (TPR) repeat protein
MAIQSDYDFVGGYEHDTEAGILHVADHHVSPGKKQWTWGNGDFGKAWDRNLTDEDGPYIELMTGVYTDNQPDFSWLMPYEEKSFSQYFMPYQKVGVVKNATKDLLINIEPVGGHHAEIKIYATSEQSDIQIKVFVENELVFEDQSDLSPESVYENSIELDHNITDENYILIIEDSEGNELIRYEPAGDSQEEIPDPAKPAKEPGEIESNEQLYLTGLHLEQYRHATYRPEVYYLEALRRDPKDLRNNNALGKWYLRQGRFEESESYFRKAIETLTERNPNPYDGEPYYNLGLCLKYQGKLDEAYAAFYKSTWNSAWQDRSYYSLAEINTGRREYEQALEHINWSLDRNARNSKGWTLKAAILRKKEEYKVALESTETAIDRDLFNLSAYYERYLIYSLLGEKEMAESALDKFLGLSHKYVQNLIAYALDYASAGLFGEAISLLSHAIDDNEKETHPMVLYYLGWCYSKKGEQSSAIQFYRKAANACPDYCFPNRLQAIPVLREAMERNKKDAMAPYYLGCLFYDKRQHELAICYWEMSKEKNSGFPTVHRNLGIAYYNKQQKPEKAIQSFENAFSLDTSDARILMELDQLYKRTNKDPGERLAFLEKHMDLVEFRDDLYLERAALYNFLGENSKAYELIMDRKFHPWEGGEGRVSGQYVYSLTEMAKQDIQAGEYQQAIEKLEKARVYPENLGEGKLYGTRENDIFYWMGMAYDGLEDIEHAIKYWQKATEGEYQPSPAIFYNDQPPEKIFYQGLAWQQLEQSEKANEIFQQLVDYGEEQINKEGSIDYFAVSLPNLLIFDDDMDLRNRIHSNFMIALGSLGLGEFSKAVSLLENILDLEAVHFGAKTHLQLVAWLKDMMVSNDPLT